jgi:hypothetical protein
VTYARGLKERGHRSLAVGDALAGWREGADADAATRRAAEGLIACLAIAQDARLKCVPVLGIKIMALLAEEIVEEWLNRQGYFTIRGIKMGVQEIDLLAVKWKSDGVVECRHLEVQASMRPVAYISRVPKAMQKTGSPANSAKRRSSAELKKGVGEWIEKKFRKKEKLRAMESLHRGPWSAELVINKVKSEDEVSLIKEHEVKILRLADIVIDLATQKSDPATQKRFPIRAAAGADIIDLIGMGKALPARGPLTPKARESVEQAIAKLPPSAEEGLDERSGS